MNYLVTITILITVKEVQLRYTDSSKDFKTIVNTTSFIDKTLLIQDFFVHNKVLLTALSGFGKSTSLDMVKRFFEIKVDELGNQKNVKTTENYNLFVKNHLKIVQNKQIFEKHFGKQPVIYIDYSDMNDINSFDSMLAKFKKVQKNTFLEHKYLLNNTELWVDGEDKTLFFTHCHWNSSLLSESKVRNGFKWLSELLCDRFDKRVIVLIDKFDTFLNNLQNITNADKARVFGFFRYMNTQLFKHNDDYIDRVLLMGDSLEKDIDVYPDNIRKESVLYDECFGKHYGVTDKERDELLIKLTNNDAERNDLKRLFDKDKEEIKEYFIQKELWRLYRYNSEPMLNSLCSFRPLVKFLQMETKCS